MATLIEAQTLFPDLDCPRRVLVELKSLGLLAWELLHGFDDFARPQQVKFYNGPPGTFLTTNWRIALPTGEEFGVFRCTSETEFWTDWFDEYLDTLNARRATLDHRGITTKDGEFYPFESVRFVKRPTQRKKTVVLPTLDLNASAIVERAKSLLAGSSVDMDTLSVFDFEDDVQAHNSRLQSKLKSHFASLFESAMESLIAEFGPPMRKGTNKSESAVHVNGHFRFAIWEIAGVELALAASHEDRELPYLLTLNK